MVRQNQAALHEIERRVRRLVIEQWQDSQKPHVQSVRVFSIAQIKSLLRP
jgi:hypothetical protein